MDETEYLLSSPRNAARLKRALGRSLALDRSAESASAAEPVFLTRPKGAPAYHGFEVLRDVVVDGFVFGAITDFERRPSDEGHL